MFDRSSVRGAEPVACGCDVASLPVGAVAGGHFAGLVSCVGHLVEWGALGASEFRPSPVCLSGPQRRSPGAECVVDRLETGGRLSDQLVVRQQGASDRLLEAGIEVPSPGIVRERR